MNKPTEHNFPYTYKQGARSTKHLKYDCYVKEVGNLRGEPGLWEAS